MGGSSESPEESVLKERNRCGEIKENEKVKTTPRI